MDILLIANRNHPLESRLAASLEQIAPDRRIRRCGDLSRLPEFLLSHLVSASVAVILAGDITDIQRLMSNRDIIRSIRTLIVLPEYDAVAAEKMQILWPRFIGYADTNYDLIIQVMKQTILKAA